MHFEIGLHVLPIDQGRSARPHLLQRLCQCTNFTMPLLLVMSVHICTNAFPMRAEINVLIWVEAAGPLHTRFCGTMSKQAFVMHHHLAA